MSVETYNILMSYLGVIESELNKVAQIVCSCSFDEYMKERQLGDAFVSSTGGSV